MSNLGVKSIDPSFIKKYAGSPIIFNRTTSLRGQLIRVNNRTVGRVWTITKDIEIEIQLLLVETLPFEVENRTMRIHDNVPTMDKFPNNAEWMGCTNLARQIIQRAKQT